MGRGRRESPRRASVGTTEEVTEPSLLLNPEAPLGAFANTKCEIRAQEASPGQHTRQKGWEQRGRPLPLSTRNPAAGQGRAPLAWPQSQTQADAIVRHSYK